MKLSLPMNNPIIFNLIYICYKYFEELTVFKPVLLNETNDFYLVGKKIKKIDDKAIINLLQLTEKDIDDVPDIFPEAFISQMDLFYKTLINKTVFFNDKKLYYFDNYNILDKRFKGIAKQYIKEKKIEWLKMYKLKRKTE